MIVLTHYFDLKIKADFGVGLWLSFSKSKHVVKRKIQSFCILSGESLGVGQKKTKNLGTKVIKTLLSRPWTHQDRIDMEYFL